ncbi:MAG: flagellar biosynthetic protein FliO, partial [Actinomycetota bacterium]
MIDASPLVLVLVLGCVLAVPVLLRHRRAQAPDALRVIGRTALSKQAVIAVVAVGERRLLVGAGEHGVGLLADLDAQPGSGHAASDVDATVTDPPVTTPQLGRTDAVGSLSTLDRAASPEGLTVPAGEGAD